MCKSRHHRHASVKCTEWTAIGWNFADFSTNENHAMRMVAHGQLLVLGRRAQTPSSWILAFAAGAYLQVTSDKLQVTSEK